MSPYTAVVAARVRMLLQYRAAALAGFTTQVFWGAIKLMVFAAFFASSTREQPMSLPEVVAYIWLGQALLALLPWNVDSEIAEQVRSGALAYDLLRPLDLYTFLFVRTLAFRTATTAMRMLPMLLLAMLVLPAVGLGDWALQPPPSLAAALMFLLCLVATVLLSTAITNLMHVALLRTLSGDGFNRLMPGLVPLLSGLVIPLPLFPDWAQPFLTWQPFRGLADVPFRVWSGHIPAAEAWADLALQLAWLALFVVAGRWLLGRLLRGVVVQGG